jgi:hypothetical protein
MNSQLLYQQGRLSSCQHRQPSLESINTGGNDPAHPALDDFFDFNYGLNALDYCMPQENHPGLLQQDNRQVVKDKQSCHSCWQYTAAHKWNTAVLPSLLCPYMTFHVRTNSRHNAIQTPTEIVPCTCGTHSIQLEVTCVHLKCASFGVSLKPCPHVFTDLDSIMLYSCKCRPVPEQLVEHGLFPCTPVLPKLSINLNMLEFATGLFVNSSPNKMAWVATLTEFLDAWGYIFATEVSIHIQALD